MRIIRRVRPEWWAVLFLLVFSRPMAGSAGASPPVSSRHFAKGEEAVGKTVFDGTTVSDIPLTIIGYIERFQPGSDLILARAEGDYMRKVGIVAGMSGSPVFVGDSLIGAMAYAWAFAKEPIVGITPIQEMLTLAKLESGRGREARLAGPDEFWRSFSSQTEAPGPEQRGGSPSAGAMVPIRTPVFLSGFDRRAVEAFSDFFERYSLLPVAAGSASEHEGSPPELEAGSAVAVELVTGDVSLSAVGTVTMRDGDKVFAFGHPLFSAGEVDFPIAGAFIHGVMPSQLSSFKFASAGAVVGSLENDLRPGILGRVGKFPELLDLQVRVGGAGFHYEVVKHRFLTVPLVSLVTLNSLLAEVQAIGVKTLLIDWRVKIRDHDVVTMRDMVLTGQPAATVAGRIAEPIEAIYSNPFRRMHIDSVGVDVTVKEGLQLSRITGLRTPRPYVEPGRPLKVTVELEKYGGGRKLEDVVLQVPWDLEAARLRLEVRDRRSQWEADKKRVPGRFRPASFDELLELIKSRMPANSFVVRLVSPEEVVVTGGRELNRMPPSMRSLFGADVFSGRFSRGSESIVAEQIVGTTDVIWGEGSLELKLKRQAAEKK